MQTYERSNANVFKISNALLNSIHDSGSDRELSIMGGPDQEIKIKHPACKTYLAFLVISNRSVWNVLKIVLNRC